MTSNLLQLVETAMQTVTGGREHDGRVILTIPVQYPSGSLAAIEVSGGRESVWISDRGVGFYEAELMGADDRYPRVAKHEAFVRGVSFDGRSVFALQVPTSQVSAGIIAVANASVAASSEAIRAEREVVISEQNQLIFEKVKRAFSGHEVTRSMDMDGTRSSWTVHNVVRISDKLAVFEPVTLHHASISAKFLMFSDLASKEVASLNAVVSNPSKMDPRGQMLRDVARIIDAEADVSVFQQSFAA